MADPGSYQIAGGLPWGGGGANAFAGFGGSPQQALASLGPAYASSYNDALAMNKAGYQNILGGFQQTMANQVGAEQGVSAGYGNLSGQVQGLLGGSNAANQQLINNAYTQQQGNALQGLINSGLGNSTVLSSVQRGIGLDQQLALTNSNNQFAQLQAGYLSQLGQAGLQYQNQAAMQNTQQANQQLGWMNSVNAAYPNAATYAQLAQQYGMFDQMQQDRNLALGRGFSNGPPSGAGYIPSGGGFPPSSVNWGQNGVQDAGGYGTPGAANAYAPAAGGNPYGIGTMSAGASSPWSPPVDVSGATPQREPDYSGAGSQTPATGYPGNPYEQAAAGQGGWSMLGGLLGGSGSYLAPGNLNPAGIDPNTGAPIGAGSVYGGSTGYGGWGDIGALLDASYSGD